MMAESTATAKPVKTLADKMAAEKKKIQDAQDALSKLAKQAFREKVATELKSLDLPKHVANIKAATKDADFGEVDNETLLSLIAEAAGLTKKSADTESTRISYPPEMKAEALKMAAAGKKNAEIAAHFKIKNTVVAAWKTAAAKAK